MNKYLNIILILILGIILGYVLGRSNPQDFKKILPLSCTYKGMEYKNGEGFMDECNSCSCTNGEIACTTMACESDL